MQRIDSIDDPQFVPMHLDELGSVVGVCQVRALRVSLVCLQHSGGSQMFIGQEQ